MKMGKSTREVFGLTLAKLGESNPDIVVLDADVHNSTRTEHFAKKFPERFFNVGIAESNLVGVAGGMASSGKRAWLASFACFIMCNAYDQLRMSVAFPCLDVKVVGTHAGISIGEDGPSQMGLEDFAMMRAIPGSVVLCPCDAVSTEKLVEQMAARPGIFYVRTSRPKTPVLYDNSDVFPIGGAKILRQSYRDQLTVVATGVTVFEALKAVELLEQDQIAITVIDAYSIKPLATKRLRDAANKTNKTILTVEDHYAEGGLGDAAAGELSGDGIAVHKLAVSTLPHSGKSAELLAKYSIDASAIAREVKTLLAQLGLMKEEPILAA